MTQARAAYGSVGTPVRTPRSAEYEVFARVTGRMKTANSKGKRHFPELLVALHENLRLWTILAADAADAGNALPELLRARILYLARFTIDHSRKVQSAHASVTPLIEINTAVMRGLRGDAGVEP